MTTRIVIPCKGFSRGKTRLAPALPPRDRVALAQALFRHVLAVAQSTGLPVDVLTDDLQVAGMARTSGAGVVIDAGGGHNPALDAANALLDPKDRLVILSADLPLLTARALWRLLRTRGDVVIATDRHALGTNALVLAPHARTGFAFAFGPDSCRRHHDRAHRRALHPQIVRDDRLAFDIDTPDDLSLLERSATFPGAFSTKSWRPHETA